MPTSSGVENPVSVHVYQCYPHDPSTQWTANAYALVPDEQIDLQTAGIIRALAEHQTLDPATVK